MPMSSCAALLICSCSKILPGIDWDPSCFSIAAPTASTAMRLVPATITPGYLTAPIAVFLTSVTSTVHEHCTVRTTSAVECERPSKLVRAQVKLAHPLHS